MKTVEFENMDFTGVTITCCSGPVSWDIIEAFVSRGCRFVVSWGTTEIGPVAIGHVFGTMDDIKKMKEIAPKDTTIVGNIKFCEYKIEDGELVVKGNICVYDDWFYTGDLVTESYGVLFYNGRKGV